MSIATAPAFLRETRDNAGPHRLGIHAYCHACGREFDREEPEYVCDTLRSEWPRKSVSFYYFHVGCGCGAKGGVQR
jgi:hypothetical protein